MFIFPTREPRRKSILGQGGGCRQRRAKARPHCNTALKIATVPGDSGQQLRPRAHQEVGKAEASRRAHSTIGFTKPSSHYSCSTVKLIPPQAPLVAASARSSPRPQGDVARGPSAAAAAQKGRWRGPSSAWASAASIRTRTGIDGRSRPSDLRNASAGADSVLESVQ